MTTQLKSANSLGEVLYENIKKYAGHPALWMKGRFYTYSELAELAWAIGSKASGCHGGRKKLAIWSYRSEVAYAGMMGAFLCGMPYVPLNPRFPLSRNLEILRQAEVGAIVCDSSCSNILASLNESERANLVVIEPMNLVLKSAGPLNDSKLSKANRDDLAYILFTSGTTGIPKGVPVTNGNVLTYLSNITEIIEPKSSDRCLQPADFTFDFSVHDIFTCWCAGATLFSLPEGMAIMSDRFIQQFDLTICSAVPSTVNVIKAEGRLKPGVMPSLRHSIIGGEALPPQLASAWQEAAPNSTITNIYGPTESTVAITTFTWKKEYKNLMSGPVPIGHAFKGQTILVVDESLMPVKAGQKGELIVAGFQVTKGYLNNPAATSERYVRLPKSNELWYRTGDLVSEHKEFGYLYHGRIDHQLKIRGFRVERHEVENHLRTAAGTDMVAVIGWPVEEGVIKGLVAFVVAARFSETQIIETCKRLLADYMVPSKVITLDELPLNANGKVDYKLLGQSVK